MRTAPWQYLDQRLGLQALYEKYQHRDFVIIGFPTNQVRGGRPPVVIRLILTHPDSSVAGTRAAMERSQTSAS
jgi:hypothetical protein